jgi:hypothetical protein
MFFFNVAVSSPDYILKNYSMTFEKCFVNNAKGSDRCLMKGNVMTFNTRTQEIEEKP